MVVQLRDFVPFFVVGVQCFIFLSVDSVEMKLALAAVFIFQVWQKSRSKKIEKTDGEEEERPQQPQPETASKRPQKNKKRD